MCIRDRSIFGGRLQTDRDASLGWRDAIFDRILDDRLQDQHGHTGMLKLLRDRHFDLQPVGKARLFDVEIEALERDFLVETDKLLGIDREA